MINVDENTFSDDESINLDEMLDNINIDEEISLTKIESIPNNCLKNKNIIIGPRYTHIGEYKILNQELDVTTFEQVNTSPDKFNLIIKSSLCVYMKTQQIFQALGSLDMDKVDFMQISLNFDEDELDNIIQSYVDSVETDDDSDSDSEDDSEDDKFNSLFYNLEERRLFELTEYFADLVNRAVNLKHLSLYFKHAEVNSELLGNIIKVFNAINVKDKLETLEYFRKPSEFSDYDYSMGPRLTSCINSLLESTTSLKKLKISCDYFDYQNLLNILNNMKSLTELDLGRAALFSPEQISLLFKLSNLNSISLRNDGDIFSENYAYNFSSLIDVICDALNNNAYLYNFVVDFIVDIGNEINSDNVNTLIESAIAKSTIPNVKVHILNTSFPIGYVTKKDVSIKDRIAGVLDIKGHDILNAISDQYSLSLLYKLASTSSNFCGETDLSFMQSVFYSVFSMISIVCLPEIEEHYQKNSELSIDFGFIKNLLTLEMESFIYLLSFMPSKEMILICNFLHASYKFTNKQNLEALNGLNQPNANRFFSNNDEKQNDSVDEVNSGFAKMDIA